MTCKYSTIIILLLIYTFTVYLLVIKYNVLMEILHFVKFIFLVIHARILEKNAVFLKKMKSS